jgi:hypothetical protein
MKLLYALSIILWVSCPAFLFPNGIKESDIADPVKQYILPDELIGDFIIPDVYINVTVSIYSSNKYIMEKRGGSYSWYEFGHIIKIDERFFFSPLQDIKYGAHISFLTGIYFTDTGFYFYGGYNNEIRMDALRKRQQTINPIAKRVNIAVKEKSRYFKKRDNNSPDEILKFTPDYSNSFSLQIDAGTVKIVFYHDDKEVFWEGYLEATEDNEMGTRGKIVFTEGAAFWRVENGIGSIIINEKYVKVILPFIDCSTNLDEYEYKDPLDMVVIFGLELQ